MSQGLLSRDLKRRLRVPSTPVLSLAEEGFADAFPSGGLAAGAHQIAPSAAGDEASALAFATVLAIRAVTAKADGRVLMVQSAEAAREGGWVYGAGLHALGLDPGRLGVLRVRTGADALRVVDEGLKSASVAAIVADLWEEPRLDLSVTRRFNLSSRRSGALALLVTHGLGGTSAALTRWRVAAARSARRRRLERPAFRLQLLRNRLGPTGEWTVEWDSHDRVFRPSAPLPLPVVRPPAHGSPAAAAPGEGPVYEPGVAAPGAYRQAG